MQCKHCGYDKRVIKYGIKPGKIIQQRWFCCSCNRYCFTPLLLDGQEEQNNKINLSDSGKISLDTSQSFQQYQKEQLTKRQSEQSEKRLIHQATSGAMNAISKKRKRR